MPPADAITSSSIAGPLTDAAPVNAIEPKAGTWPASVPASQTVTPTPTAPAPARQANPSAEKTEVVSQAPPRRPLISGSLSAPIVKRPSAVPGEEPAPSVEILSEAIPASGNLNAIISDSARTLPASAVSPAQPPKAATGGHVQEPRLVKSIPPTYPPVARQRKMEGDVAVEVTIDASGNVAKMRVVSGPAFFHQAALDAVRNWKYQPATLNDQPVSADVLVVLKFRINN